MYRALATANAFANAGWKVTVIAPEREIFYQLTDVDELAESAIDPRIDVVRVPFDLARGESDLRRWSRFRAESPLAWSGVTLLREKLQFPEPRYGGWRREIVRAALRVHDTQPVDLVIGTANPNVDFLPGWELNKRFKIPYVMDYRDTWHLDMYSGERTSPYNSRSSRWERRLLAQATEVWFVNSPIKDWHEQEYPEIAGKTFVVSNGYDESFLSEFSPKSREPNEPLSIGYLGTIYGPMPLAQVFEGWRIARSHSSLLSRSTLDVHGRLGHFATPDPQAKETLDRFREHGVVFHGKVSKTEVSRTYSQFDALALILGRSRYITSGKVFEYVATGLPIVALHHPETASTAILEEYPRAVLATDDTAQSFADAFLELAALIERSTALDGDAARRTASVWERRRQLTPRIEKLRRTIEVGQ